MRTDQVCQQKSYKFSAKLSQNKLILQINDGSTYRGFIESSPYFDIEQLKSIFEKGEVQVLNKTTSKIIVRIGLLKVEMPSEQSHQMELLKTKLAELQIKVKQGEGEWEDENMNSKELFDTNYIYKIDVKDSGGYTCLSSSVNTSYIYFFAAGSNYYITYSNRKTCTAGWAVYRIQKKKI